MSSTTAASAAPLRGRSAVITGASRGIGRECARALSRAGCAVVLLGRDLDAMTAVGAALEAEWAALSLDLATPDRVPAVVDAVRARLGGAPDLVVNNAAQFFLAPVEETSIADFQRTLAVNVTSHFALVHGFLAAMRERGSGHVVTIGSIADVRALEGNAAYSASKFGLRGLHGVIREETRGTGVRATLVSPARVDTDIWRGIEADGREAHPRSGMLAPEDVADAVVYAVTRPVEVNIDELRLSRA
jgi:NADP-dependent 3-hydroxy acid dehydrogenase YdfG